MEDFEYSVEISDRDWNCFFTECEECNLLPPSIAGLDDSGMSDIDDTKSILAKRFQKVDPTASLSEADCLIDDPLDCGGSPVERYLSKHGLGGMESILSGSEEDLHLQSVNVFFERLKSGTEAEELSECSQVRDGKKRGPRQEGEKCSDGHGAMSSVLPKNSPKLNSLAASSEAEFGKVTMEPVNTISNVMKTIKQEKPVSHIFPKPKACDSVIKTENSAHSNCFIREDAGTITRKSDGRKWNQSCTSQDSLVLSETTTHTEKVVKMDMCKAKDDIKMKYLLTKQGTVSKKSSTDSRGGVETLNNHKWTEEPNTVSQPEAPNTNKILCTESSPSASLKRKRRKKRRLSVEAESVHGYERQVSVKQSDSEEEQRALKGGTGFLASENFHFSFLNQPQKTVIPSFTSYPATINLPMKITSSEKKVNNLSHYSGLCGDQYQYTKESLVKHTVSMEDGAQNKTPPSQTNRNLLSMQNNRSCVESNLKPHCKLQEEPEGLHKNPGLPVLITGLVNGTSPLGGSLWQSNDINHTTNSCESEQKKGLYTAEIDSLTNGVLQSPESNDLALDVCQNDKRSAVKSVLALEPGNSGRNKHSPCQREAEAQQQLEIDYHDSDQYSSSLGKTQFPPSAVDVSSSDIHNSQPKPMEMKASPSIEKMSCSVDCAKLTRDTNSTSPDEFCQSKSSPVQERNMTEQQTESLYKFISNSQLDKDKLAERDEEEIPEIMSVHSNKTFLPGEINNTGNKEKENNFYSSEDLPTNGTHVTPVSSCCTNNTQSQMSVLNENSTDRSESSHLSVSQNDSESQREKTSSLLTKHEANGSSTPKSESVSEDTADSKYDSLGEADEATLSNAECETEQTSETQSSVFAISSFWNEMEKLTINDILGLRRFSKTPPSGSLPPLQETEETGLLAMTDSGFFTQLDECKPEHTNEDTANDLDSNSSYVMEVESSSSEGVMWEKEPVTLNPVADVYPNNTPWISVSDNPKTVLPGKTQTCLKRISKNISVHNLPALESKSIHCARKCQTLQTSDKQDLDKDQCFSNGQTPMQEKDCAVPSSTDSFKISLTSIFQSLFGGEKSPPSPSATDTITSSYTCGDSVSESYDYFLSEFDTESLFHPLVTTEDQTKDKLVPIFSCSRSANKNLQYPESYEQFFASSSDDSSDDEDLCGPVRVVTRLNRIASASKICTDIYDNFFTDKDLKQDFFWKNSFSFRNVNFAGSKLKTQTLSNPEAFAPLGQTDRSPQRTASPINALGNQDVIFPDPLLYHLEDRISRQLVQEPFIHKDLQMSIANPRLDASLLPLRHSDMCLLCIAFASWVMKTTNPQVGDAWKAVLLANVSALSAIRYLRKYVKMEAASSEKKLHCTTPSSS